MLPVAKPLKNAKLYFAMFKFVMPLRMILLFAIHCVSCCAISFHAFVVVLHMLHILYHKVA